MPAHVFDPVVPLLAMRMMLIHKRALNKPNSVVGLLSLLPNRRPGS
ncbi:hypothetical protein [Synechococcus sp. M16CYN]